MTLCSEDISATCNLKVISLEYVAIFDVRYATTTGKLCSRIMSISYTTMGSIHYRTLCKKDSTWKMNVYKFVHYKACCFYFLISVMNLQTKMKIFATLVSQTFWQQLMESLSCFLQQFHTFTPSYKKSFYKDHSNVKWKELLMTKFGQWIGTSSNTDSSLRGSSRAIENSDIFL